VFEIGSSLREARLRQAVELPEAEAATKVRAKYLRALEEEQFDVLPAQTYVKGFLRAYAEFLGLDGQLYVDEYNSRYVPGEEEPLLRPRRSGTPSKAHRRIESSVVALALIGIATAAALVIVAWKWGGTSPSTLPNFDGAVAPVTTGAGPRAAAPGRQQRPFSIEMLAVRGPSLVTVRRGSATGPILFSGTIPKGKSQGFTQKRVWADVAIPGNLVVKIRGKRQPVLRSGRIIVMPTGVRAAPAS
jgi:cytoskeleton protein RodZ